MTGTPTSKARDRLARPRVAGAVLAATLFFLTLVSPHAMAVTELALSDDLVGLPGQTVTSLLTITDTAGVSVIALAP